MDPIALLQDDNDTMESFILEPSRESRRFPIKSGMTALFSRLSSSLPRLAKSLTQRMEYAFFLRLSSKIKELSKLIPYAKDETISVELQKNADFPIPT